jgi:hypothetical protein
MFAQSAKNSEKCDSEGAIGVKILAKWWDLPPTVGQILIGR